MATAYLYSRFSSKAQAKGSSLDRQHGAALEYCALHGLTLNERRYSDLGISAFKGKNLLEGALGTFINGVKSGVIPRGSHLLVESLDRVSREVVLAAMKTFMSILEEGIVLVTLMDKRVYTWQACNKDPFLIMQALMTMVRANEESEVKSVRVKKAWVNKKTTWANKKQGLVLRSVGPSWLELKGSRWVQKKDKVEIVRRIFKDAAAGLGTPTIARALIKDKVPTLGGERTVKGEKKIAVWTPELVMSVLKNRSVLGDLVSRERGVAPIPGYYGQGIIKPDTFKLVQSHIAKRVRGGPKGGRDYSVNLLSGRLFCVCGSKMRYVSSNPPHIYVQCLRSYNQDGCAARKWSYGALESALLEYLLGYRIADVIAFTTTEEPDQRVVLEQELVEKQRQLDNLIAVAKAGSDYGGGIPSLVKAIEDAQGEVDEAMKKLHGAPSPVTLTQLLGDDRAIEAAVDLHEEHERLKKTRGPLFTAVRAKVEVVVRHIVQKAVLEKQSTPLDFTTASGATEAGTATLHFRSGRTDVLNFHLPPRGFQKGNINGTRKRA